MSFFSKEQVIPAVNYSKSDSDRPRLSASETETDFGSISVKQEVSKDFVVKNTGNKPLQISKINSSCNCTTVKYIYEGKESAEFGMHNPGRDVFEIAPGSEAVMKVIYRPFVMPVYGFVSREAYAETNDPDFPRLILKVKTTVNK